jgi:hypothetical protein
MRTRRLKCKLKNSRPGFRQGGRSGTVIKGRAKSLLSRGEGSRYEIWVDPLLTPGRAKGYRLMIFLCRRTKALGFFESES